ncbi:hypothetical protein Q8W71_31785 [Methylobacterium sp. NEAU 140]|uniref:hypothetical protein n=1 Tax=Methylobacterium sp. NEAU 140 TaxID=3064945 RepID=UPI002732DA9E|nr:hypothetical protein [Methylobacterium sp. NEAU 140]MDP4027162.1 hypothetical protein [Methylobacterium sp. NEAU 140]
MHENDQEAARRITADLAYFADAGPRWCAYMASKALLIAPARLAFEAEMPGMDARLRTNIATLLGAGFAALHGRVPTTDEVVAEVAEFAATTAEHAEEVSRDDSLEALHHLLAHPIGDSSLGQWIARERRDWIEKNARDESPSARILASLDITMSVFGNEPGFFLARGAPGINKIFERTKWEQGGWMHAIRKYEGAFSPVNPIYFSNIKSKARAIGVRFDILPDPTEAPIEPIEPKGDIKLPKGTPDF